MPIGLLGKKLGMTHIYDEYGRRISVTAVQAGPCTVLEVRTPEKHQYQAVQIGFETADEKSQTKPVAGRFKKLGHGPFRHVREFRVNDSAEWKVGQQLTVELFQDYELVDVSAISIGKGFQGGMKRWHWSGGPETHGSMSHRAPGASGSGTTPGRVYKGHHFPGHMGSDRVTIQSIKVIQRDAENNILLLAGSVPGAEDTIVEIKKSIKKPGVIKKPQLVQSVVDEEDEASKKKAPAKKK
jgi:large subunit ribosomal protein L3